jgi:hypothetical protein
VASEREPLRGYVKEIAEVAAPLDPGTGDCQGRQRRFDELRDRLEKAPDPIHDHMVRLMIAFCGGLFAGGDDVAEVLDNLDLERWFRLPKGHERRIQGHRHAGVRIVREGPTLVLVLDAHQEHSEPLRAEDLLAYRTAREPDCQREAMDRRKIMRKARSKKKRNGCSSSDYKHSHAARANFIGSSVRI